MEYKPLSGREMPRFAGIKTFFRLPVADVTHDCDVLIVGVPYDGGVSYRPGARFAPSLIREVSSLGRGFHLSRNRNVFENKKIADGGDCSIVPIDQSQTYQKVETHFSEILKSGKKFLAVGGDHSLALPLLRTACRHVGQPLQLIHFDAHLDTYPAAWNCEYHHGSFLRHAVEEGLVDAKKSVQFGIRGPLAGGDDLDFVRHHGFKIFTVDDVRENSLSSFLSQIPQFDGPTYLTFDIDCLDPAYAPGTGTPVPGGLTTYETQRILRALKIKNLVAADLVEVSPPFDSSQITGLAAVDTLFEILCLL